MEMLQFHQIFPGRSPRARAHERTVRSAQKPFGMVLLQIRSPAGVIDDHVQEHPRVPRMDRVGQFAKLVHPRGAPVKFHERGINVRQVLANA